MYIFYTGSKKISAPSVNGPEDFVLIFNPETVILSESTISQSITNEVVYYILDSGESKSVGSIIISKQLGGEINETYNNLSPSIVSVDSTGYVDWVSNGSGSINVSVGRMTRRIYCPVSKKSNVISITYKEFISGSKAHLLSSSISNDIIEKTPSSENYNLFSSINDSSKTYTRNANLWESNVNWSCIPVYSSTQGSKLNGVLVARDILIQAFHGHSTGIIYFVSSNNTTYSSSVISGKKISNTDIYVALLSPPVSTEIISAKVYPSSSVDFSSNALSIKQIPVVFTNQNRQLRIGVMEDFGVIFKPSGSAFENWYTPVISGDSGSPFFIIINGEAVALGTWFTSNLSSFSSGPAIGKYITEINSAISDMGSTSSLITASFI